MITAGEKQTLLEELTEKYFLPPRQPGDVDATQLARKLGITWRACKNILDKEVEAGTLEAVMVRGEKGRTFTVYRRR